MKRPRMDGPGQPAIATPMSQVSDLAGFLNVQDWATYGSITSQNWWYQSSGCGSPDERILWGNSVDTTVARVIQADCIDPYTAQPRR
jgi:hypothetical protein